MKRRLRISLGVFTAIGILSLVAMGFYIQSTMPSVPSRLKTLLAQRGLRLDFDHSHANVSGLGFQLHDVTLRGDKLASSFTAKKISASLDLTMTLPPLRLSVSVEHLVATPDSASLSRSSPPIETPLFSSRATGIASALLSFIRLKLSLSDASLTQPKAKHISLSLEVRQVKFNERGIERATIDHDLIIGEIENVVWLDGIRWKGNTRLDNFQASAQEHEISIGPLLIPLAGRYDFRSQKWRVELAINENEMKPNSPSIAASQSKIFKSMTGKLGIRLSAQGLGSDWDRFNAEGSLKASQLIFELSGTKITGPIAVESDLEFSKSEAVALKGHLTCDLTKARIEPSPELLKPAGTTMRFSTALASRGERIIVSEANLQLRNLAINGSGNFDSLVPPQGEFQIDLARSDLSGWESFFPKSAAKAAGEIQGQLRYRGQLSDWKNAEIEASFHAAKVNFPMIKGGGLGSVELNGSFGIDTETKVSYKNGALRQLTTRTEIDLKETALEISNTFKKAPGVPLGTKFSMASKGEELEIKPSSMQLGSMRGRFSGRFEHLPAPEANLNFETEKGNLGELAGLWPLLDKNGLHQMSGTAKLSGKLVGDFSNPKLSGEVILSEAGVNWGAIALKKASGSVSFLPDLFDVNLKEFRVGEFKFESASARLKKGASHLAVDPIHFKAIEGTWTATAVCDTTSKDLPVQATLNIEEANANKLIAFSERGRNLVSGRLTSNLSASFSIATPEELKKTLSAKGTYSLIAAHLSSIHFSEQPLLAAKRLPVLGSTLTKTKWDEPIDRIAGKFQFAAGTWAFLDTKLESKVFNATARDATIDSEMNLAAKIEWRPKPSQTSATVLNSVEEPIPLLLKGPFRNPSVSIDEPLFAERVKAFTKRKNNEGRERALATIKGRLGKMRNTRITGALKNLFK